MKYIKLFEEFSGLDPLEILPDGILMQIWRNISDWYSMTKEEVESSKYEIPTSFNKIVIIVGNDERYNGKNVTYLATVTTDEDSRDPDALYAIIWEDDEIVARQKVDSFLEGISQLIAWTDMEGHHIVQIDVDDTNKMNLSAHLANVTKTDLDKTGGIQDMKMRKIGRDKSRKISKWPMSLN